MSGRTDRFKGIDPVGLACGLAWVLGCVLCSSVSAQMTSEEPQVLKVRLSDMRFVCRLATDTEERLVKSTGTFGTFEKEVLTPSLSMNILGSIYHSRLLSFSLGGDYGLSIEETSSNLDERDDASGTIDVLSYNFGATILSSKPYPVSIYSSRTKSRRDYDQFTRVTFERDAVGVGWRLRNAFMPFRIDWESWSEESVDEIRINRREETSLDLRATHDRGGIDRTLLSYIYEDFFQQYDFGDEYSGQIHSAEIIDTRILNDQKKSSIRSTLYYRSLTSEDNDDRSLRLLERYKSQYTENSQLFAQYRFESRGRGAFDSQSHQGKAELRHQLYDSLRSTFSVEATTSSAGGEGVDDMSRSYGGGVSELYNKKLGAWGKLRVNLGLSRKDETRSSGTATTSIIRESVSLTDGATVLLGSPGIASETVEVTDSSGSRIYLRDRDYRLIPRGAFLEIQRAIGGEIPNGSSVRVSYLATADMDVTVSSLSRDGGIALSLFDDLLQVYGRNENIGYDGDVSLAYQDSEKTEVGVSFSYKWFRAGISRETYESESTAYDTTRSYQSFRIRPWRAAYVGLEGSQVVTAFAGDNSEQVIDTYSLQYSQGIGKSLALSSTMAVRSEVLDDVARDSTSMDVTCEYKVGKLKIDLSHSLTELDSDTERRDKGRTIVRVERRFW